MSVILILAAWQGYGSSINPVLLSDPAAVAGAFAGMVRDGTLPRALGASVAVLGVGFGLGAVTGIAGGLAAGRSAALGALLDIPVSALYAVPAVALIPVIVLWFGFAATAKIVVVFLFTVFTVFINTLRGVREADPELGEVARSFCSSERRMWADLVLPSALPYIVTGLRLAVGRALIGVIVAEYYTSASLAGGLGDLIQTNASNFDTARMFVPVVVIAVLGVALTALLELAERRLAPWGGADPDRPA